MALSLTKRRTGRLRLLRVLILPARVLKKSLRSGSSMFSCSLAVQYVSSMPLPFPSCCHWRDGELMKCSGPFARTMFPLLSFWFCSFLAVSMSILNASAIMFGSKPLKAFLPDGQVNGCCCSCVLLPAIWNIYKCVWFIWFIIVVTILIYSMQWKIWSFFNSYPRDLVKLVFSVGNIKNDHDDDVGIAAVVPPLWNSGKRSKHISSPEILQLLVHVLKTSMHVSSYSSSSFFISLRTARSNCPHHSFSCKQ